MSYNNDFTGSTEVYLSYAKGRENTNKKPKAIQEVEKLIATLEAEGGEAAKPLIEKKQAEIYELEAEYGFAKLVLSKMEHDEDYQQRMAILSRKELDMKAKELLLERMEQDEKRVMNFQFTFHKNGQRYYAEGTFYSNRYKPNTNRGIFGMSKSFLEDNSECCWLGIILESNEPKNGKVIKGGSIGLNIGKNNSFNSLRSDDKYSIDAVLQTIDGEIVTICQTLYKI